LLIAWPLCATDDTEEDWLAIVWKVNEFWGETHDFMRLAELLRSCADVWRQ
jgi:hypothetical protein